LAHHDALGLARGSRCVEHISQVLSGYAAAHLAIDTRLSRGERLFYDVASAGSVQSIEGRPPLRVVLGNAAAVSVQVDGQPREIPAAAVDGEGARFVVNRSGKIARSRQ
jgi:hypothetical protein